MAPCSILRPAAHFGRAGGVKGGLGVVRKGQEGAETADRPRTMHLLYAFTSHIPRHSRPLAATPHAAAPPATASSQ
jgi:hypothetical protein